MESLLSMGPTLSSFPWIIFLYIVNWDGGMYLHMFVFVWSHQLMKVMQEFLELCQLHEFCWMNFIMLNIKVKFGKVCWRFRENKWKIPTWNKPCSGGRRESDKQRSEEKCIKKTIYININNYTSTYYLLPKSYKEYLYWLVPKALCICCDTLKDSNIIFVIWRQVTTCAIFKGVKFVNTG